MRSLEPSSTELYDPRFIGALFDEMARTYGLVHMISSLGFARRWRRQCVRLVTLNSESRVLDLMTGMGELCPDISRFLSAQGELIAVDLSSVMCQKARRHRQKSRACSYEVVQANALQCPFPAESFDVIYSTFGLKTFSPSQLEQLAEEVARLLRPGGQFAFLEISVPANRWLRWPYLFYLNHVIPRMGRLFLGNPDNYRMLGIYTTAFINCDHAAAAFARRLNVTRCSFFFGCATGFHGRKPPQSEVHR